VENPPLLQPDDPAIHLLDDVERFMARGGDLGQAVGILPVVASGPIALEPDHQP
jgi:hypothetical protein